MINETKELNLRWSNPKGVQIDPTTIVRVVKMGGNEIDHVDVKHAMVKTTQVEVVYNFDDDLLETHHMNCDL